MKRSAARLGRPAPARSPLALLLLAPLLLALLAGGVTVRAQEPEPTSAASARGGDAGLEQPVVDPDARAARELYRRLEQIPDLRDWNVAVDDGVARIEGTALTALAREQAAEAALEIPGIDGVENELALPPDLEKRVVPALMKLEQLGRDFVAHLPLFGVAALLVIFFAWLAALAARWDWPYRHATHSRFVRDLSRQVVRVAVILVGVVLALEVLDATALVGAVLGTAGVAGIAIGFAFRDMAENFIASILLSLRQPFDPNDLVRIDDLEGKVVSLTSRATILMTLDGNHLRIPNSKVFKGVILNYTRNPMRRFDFGVGVGVDEDLVEAQRLGVETLRAIAQIPDEPEPWAVITELGDSSVVVRFYGWVDQREASFVKVKSEAIRRVKLALEDFGMDLPEPIYRVKLEGGLRAGASGEEARRATVEGSAAGEVASGSRPKRERRLSEPAAGELDAPEDDIDHQIAAERASGETQDLLDEDAPKE